MWLIHANGRMNTEESAKARDVYPVVYLKSNASISSGRGTIDNKYTLVLN